MPITTGDLITAELLTNMQRFPWTMPGSWFAGFAGTAYPSGNAITTRAPGTGYIVVPAWNISVHLQAHLHVEAAGATAFLGIFASGAPDTVVSSVSSTSTDGQIITTAAFTLLSGLTYLLKGHSNHATLQAWAENIRVYPA
jgi:hypothetical protein